MVGLVLSAKLATLHDLQTVYSYRDLLDLAEVAMVTGYNEWAVMESAKDRNSGNGR